MSSDDSDTQIMDTPSPEQSQDSHPVSPSMEVHSPIFLEEAESSHASTTKEAGSQQGHEKRTREPLPVKPKKKKNKRTTTFEVDPSDFSTDDVIDLVHARPSLWDKKNKKHSDNIYNRKKWDEIYVSLFPDYLKYDLELQDVIGTKVQKRWRSVRDCYFKWLQKTKLPSGSGAKITKYKHAAKLSFLKNVSDLRPTASNVETLQDKPTDDVEEGIEVEELILESETTAPSTKYTMSKRHSSKKKIEAEKEKLYVDSLEKLENSVTNKLMQLDIRILRLEGMITGPPPSPCRDFLLTLVPMMERMNEEEQNNYKIKLLRITHEFLYPPPPPPPATSFPPPSPSMSMMRPRPFNPQYPPQRYDETFESEEGQVFRRI